MGKQQTAQAGAPRDNARTWGKINWNHARREVRRLQIRIAKATLDGRWNKVELGLRQIVEVDSAGKEQGPGGFVGN